MEELLKSGLVNLSALSVLLYPSKTRAGAAAKLHQKVYRKHGQSLSHDERTLIFNVVCSFGIKLYSTLCAKPSEAKIEEIQSKVGCGREGAIRRAYVEQLENNKYL